MTLRFLSVLLLTSTICLSSCSSATENERATIKKSIPPSRQTTEQALDGIEDEVATNENIPMSKAGVLGIRPGMKIIDLGTKVQKQKMVTSDGVFDTYRIIGDGGEKIGMVMVDPVQKTLTGDVIVSSSKVVTAEGIRVGQTYGDLKKALVDFEIKGSKKDGSTIVTSNGLSYILQVSNKKSDLGKDEVNDDVLVKEILIKR